MFGGWFEISVSTGGLKSALQWLHVQNDECAGGHFLHTWGEKSGEGRGLISHIKHDRVTSQLQANQALNVHKLTQKLTTGAHQKQLFSDF